MQIFRTRQALAVTIFVVCILALIAGFRGPLAAALIPRIIGSATGTSVDFTGMQLHASRALFTGVNVRSHAGQEIAYIPRLEIAYDLHDLLPGSRHRFGLHSIVVYDPQITIIHNRDGTYNIPQQAQQQANPRQAAPLGFSARVFAGRLTVDDYTRVHAESQHLYIDDVNVNAVVNTAATTTYTASLAYREGSRRYPVYGNGSIDEPTGVNLQHWSAARIPLPRILNYALNDSSLKMLGGAMQNADVRFYGKLAASAYVSGVKVAMAQLREPIRDGQGRLDVSSDAATTTGLSATLNKVPVRVSGGVSDFAHPHLRFVITGQGDVSQLTKVMPQTARLPMRGHVDLAMMAEGTLQSPLVLISVRSPRIDYKNFDLRAPAALVAFDGHEVDVLSGRLGYRRLALGAQGRFMLKSQPNALQMFATVRGPSGDLPFASAVLPSLLLRAGVLATADDLKKIDTRGIVSGAGSGTQLAGLFHINSLGLGDVGPLAIDARDRSLYSRIAIDHPHNATQALVSARNFVVSYHGTATINGNAYADMRGKEIGMLGDAGLRNANYGKIAIAQAHARFGGQVGDVRVSSLDASGSFGTLHATGTISGTDRVALEGRFNGSLGALSKIAGNLPASGNVDAPIALVYDGGRAIAQIHEARFSHANVRGLPIEGLSATIGTQGKNVRIYAAHAAIAHNGSASVLGSLKNGMVLTVAHLDMAALRSAGLPLQSGYANAGARMRGPITAPNVSGAVLLDRGLYAHYPIDASAAFDYSGDKLALRDGVVGFGKALVAIDGNVSGIRMGASMRPQYDLDASMRAADAHALIAMTQPKLARQDIQGSIDANVHVGGSASAPSVSGNFNVPEGSVHGLAFRELHATLRGTPSAFRVGDGSVSIGSTALAFNGSLAKGTTSAALRAPKANLADFNDYFDTGDTLAGTGRLAMDIAMGPSSIATSGDARLAGVRFRRFDLGNADANWGTTGRTIALSANVGGTSGRANLRGIVNVPPFSTAADLATRATTDLDATVSNLDLGTWMPMFGFNAPVTGKLDATAGVDGQFPDETLSANASLHSATVGRIRLERAQIAVSALRGRGKVTSAFVRIPYMTASGSGTFGLHANDPIDLAVRATSADVGSLLETVSGKPQNLAGLLDTTLRLQGTRISPQLNDTFNLTHLRYGKFTIPRIAATLAATSAHVELRNGLVQLPRGTVTASGMLPIKLGARGIDPPDKPVRFAMRADNVDFSDFERALPEGTQLAGTLGGAMTIGGTVDNPQLDGTIVLHNGYFAGPIDQNPISQMNGSIVFAGKRIALQAVRANVGGGTLNVNGAATVPNVRDFRAATFNASIVANGAQFNSPQYFRGKLDANIVASRNAGAAPMISGTVNLPSARIPLSAFWNPRAPQGPKKQLPDVGLNVTATVGNDVRVQSSNVDVGAQGHVTVAGNLRNPTLKGRFMSTGGTVSFFRTFDIQNADVDFNPGNGIMPFINATATTNISSPETYVALNVNGLAPDNMHLTFSSDPQYSEQQIMGLLAGVGGPGGPALAGAGDFSANSAVEGLATGEINTFFTRSMLEPLSAQLGSSLGLQNLQLTDDFHSGFGVSAAKAFGKHLTAVYGENLGQPRRQTLSIEAHRGQSTAFDLMLYNVQSPTLLAFTQSANLLGFDSGAGTSAISPTLGSNGLSLMYEHKF